MFKKICIPLIFTAVLLSLMVACGKEQVTVTGSGKEIYVDFVSDIEVQYPGDSIAVVDTDKGMFAFELYEGLVPKTAENFVKLVGEGFYNGLLWHRVVPGVLIQTGDPTGLGTKGADVSPLPLEVHPDLIHDTAGVVAMARKENDINSATSQFYITLVPQPEWDRKYAVFGKVLKGLDVLPNIEQKDHVKRIVVVKK